jgi:2-polyprenyl-6-methoxyphenol hydroxylase-like FAD-dependent oxidoreductase
MAVGRLTRRRREILRGDLAEILYAHTAGNCEYLFSDSITALTEARTACASSSSSPRTVDLAFGADGMHARARRLFFGPEADHVRFQGYRYAIMKSR